MSALLELLEAACRGEGEEERRVCLKSLEALGFDGADALAVAELLAGRRISAQLLRPGSGEAAWRLAESSHGALVACRAREPRAAPAAAIFRPGPPLRLECLLRQARAALILAEAQMAHTRYAAVLADEAREEAAEAEALCPPAPIQAPARAVGLECSDGTTRGFLSLNAAAETLSAATVAEAARLAGWRGRVSYAGVAPPATLVTPSTVAELPRGTRASGSLRPEEAAAAGVALAASAAALALAASGSGETSRNAALAMRAIAAVELLEQAAASDSSRRLARLAELADEAAGAVARMMAEGGGREAGLRAWRAMAGLAASAMRGLPPLDVAVVGTAVFVGYGHVVEDAMVVAEAGKVRVAGVALNPAEDMGGWGEVARLLKP